MARWLRFNAVGIVGAGVQLAVLSLLLRWHVNYLAATALAIEVALLHNFMWHKRWTWAGQPASLWRFHVSNGLGSLICNLLLMRLLAGAWGLPKVPSNLVAITLTSFVNFTLATRWVFTGYHVKVR